MNTPFPLTPPPPGPLEHVAFGLAGGVAGYYYSNWAEQNTAEYLKTVERYEASTRSQANPTQ